MQVYGRRTVRPAIATVLCLLWLTGTADAARVPLPDTFRVHHEPCPSEPHAAGCAMDSGDVYVTDKSRFTRWHEIGHVFDAQALTDSDRALFSRLLHAGLPWHRTDDAYDRHAVIPSERFADAYALCALGRSPAGRRGRRGQIIVNWPDAYGYQPGVRRHQRICNTIVFVGLVRSARGIGR